MRSIFIALTLVTWLILGWIYWQDYNRCCNPDKLSLAEGSYKVLEPAFVFDYNQSVPKFKKRWLIIKDSLSRLVNENHILEITGLLCPNEADSVGIQRAKKIRETFSKIEESQILITTKAMECDTTHVRLPFEAVDLNIRYYSKSIQEVGGKVLIYFPNNSTSKLQSEEIEKYLNQIVEKAIKNKSIIQLTGHADNQGSPQKNQILGFQRANAIKSYLVSQGMIGSNIKLISLGENQPIATNSTEAGRAKNRRTELAIISTQ